MNHNDGVSEVCARVSNVLKTLPTPTGTSREDFFKRRNLWSVEIQSTCSQAIEHYRSILSLIDQGLHRPAASLSRNIHEACFRFEYLSRNKVELRDWMEWQLGRDYHFIKDFLQYETAASDSSKQNFEDQMKDLNAFMGRPPDKPKFPWKSTGHILCNISSGMPVGYKRRLRRLLYDYPSRYVHISAGGAPTSGYVLGASQASLLLTITIGTELCRDEQLVSTKLSREIEEIITLCNKLRGIEEMGSES